MTATFATGEEQGYNGGVRPSKTARINAYLLPSVKAKLQECAVALEMSEADAVAEAIKRLHKSKDVQEALAKKQESE